jgi:MFS family permease
MPATRRQLGFILFVLFGINFMNFFDRQIPGAVGESIRKQWDLSDTALGNLNTAFILLYAVIGLPLGRLADVGPRTKILAGGVTVWSLLTAASGWAWNLTSLYITRLGVGVGEASCAPTSTSLLGDLFPEKHRARAMSVFMFGLPLGVGTSLILSGWIDYKVSEWIDPQWGWRAAFYVAALPGLVLAVLSFFIPDPPRGTVEKHAIGAARRPGSALALVLLTPTMIWIILSGALHNFNMYAIGAFLSPLLQRYHALNPRDAGLVSGIVYGLGGGVGILLGGWACDKMVKRRISGRLEVGAIALLISTPCIFLALQAPQNDLWGFFPWMLVGCSLLYVYYSSVYSTIQDIIEPSLRGTAMALYFFAMYLIGAALGPVGTGWLSDYFRGRAAQEGLDKAAAAAIGLHNAMYIVPVLDLLLVIVMLAASRTVTRDYRRLQDWIAAYTATREKAASDSPEPVKL